MKLGKEKENKELSNPIEILILISDGMNERMSCTSAVRVYLRYLRNITVCDEVCSLARFQ